MTALRKALLKQLYKKSLYEFVKAFWSEADSSKFIDGKLVQFYCEVFQYFCRSWVGYEPVDIKVPKMSDTVDVIDVRGTNQNLNINVPPRHSKSMIFNVFGPTWLWLSYPITAVSVSHTTGLASSMNKKRAKIVHSKKFQELFGDEIHLTSQSAFALETKEGGDLRSQARESFTGFGADIIINDDLTNAETARRDQAEMLSAWSYFQNTMPSRINNPDKCLIMNIQQRLAPNDITGHMLEDPKLSARYSFIVLQAIFEKDTYLVCPISGDVFFFPKGSALWPERFKDNYESLRDQTGPAVFETQYQQHAVASDKTVIKQEMIVERSKNEVPDIADADVIYSSHDFPVKDKESSDFLGSLLAYRCGRMLYIVDCLEKKMAYVKSVEYVKNLDGFYPGIIQVIEDKANGSPILQQLQDEVPGMQPFNPGTASKTQRLESASMYMSNVVFVKSMWNEVEQKYMLSKNLDNLKQRLIQFPFVEHDDIVDAFSQLLLFVFMDRRHMVYGRAFNDMNIAESCNSDYSVMFFNKEGDIWKVCEICMEYAVTSIMTVKRETRFKASMEDGLEMMKEFGNGKSVFIDCSATPAMVGVYSKGQYVERYEIDDFDRSVTQLNLAFSKKVVKVMKECKLTLADIENFKFSKTKDENVRYVSQKDGFVACIRVAMKYFGGF